MRRRNLIRNFGLVVVWPIAARAQQRMKAKPSRSQRTWGPVRWPNVRLGLSKLRSRSLSDRFFSFQEGIFGRDRRFLPFPARSRERLHLEAAVILNQSDLSN